MNRAEVLERAASAPSEPLKSANDAAQLRRYYEEAGMDYQAWSSGFHMHFGYWRRGLNPLRREAMLEEMNQQVFNRVWPSLAAPGRVADLGCGLGAAARSAARRWPQATVEAFTLVDWQVAQARRLTEATNVQYRVADYEALDGVEDERFDAAFALESSCHGRGLDKRFFLQEAARILRPGGRLVVADGFLKRGRPRCRLLRWLFDTTCHNWAVESFADLDPFLRRMEQEGFRRIAVEEISWRIAPSALHVPWVSLRFLCRDVLRSPKKMTGARWGHLLACMLSPLVGLARRHFGYYLITAERG